MAMMGMCAVLMSECKMRGISCAPISLRLVAQIIAVGVSHSSMVSAYADCAVCATSKPSRLSASPNRRAKNTLPSMTRILGVGSAASVLMQPPPPASICRPFSHCTCFGSATQLEHPLFYRAANVFQRQHFVHHSGLDRFRRHTENHGTGFVLSDYVPASLLYAPHAARPIISHTGEDHSDCHGARIGRRTLQRNVGARPVTPDAL